MSSEQQMTPEELSQMRALLDAYEAQYEMPSHRVLEVPGFLDEAGALRETDDLLAWSSLWDKYELLTAS